MEKVQSTRKPWPLAIQLCPIILCLPRARTPLVIQDMAIRGASDEGKEIAQSIGHKTMKTGVMFRGNFLSTPYLLIFRVTAGWQHG